MNLHRTIDRIAGGQPRIKVLSALAGFIFLLIAILIIFKLGEASGAKKASIDYYNTEQTNIKRADESELKAKIARNQADRLAKSNHLLKQQIEIQAEVLRQNDARLAGNAQKLTKLLEERNHTFGEIEGVVEIEEQIRRMCEDAKEAGFSFSEKLCGNSKK